MDLYRYQVKPGTSPRLALRNPGDKTEVPATKRARENASHKIGAQIDVLQNKLYAERRRSVLIVLQGMDTAGKDGTIRHVFNAIDPLGVRAVCFRAPAGAELEHDFLWRVHAEVPRFGEIVIFNRSHYEDVLITGVHRWIDKSECKRRYRVINDFEQQLANSGTIILKFFLNISKDEQRRRLQDRINDPNKRWKFNPQDLEERKHWDEYQTAYEDAIAATSSERAPWHVIPGNSKSTRNLLVSMILKQTMESMNLKYPAPAQDYSKIIVN